MMTGTARVLALILMLEPMSLCGGQDKKFDRPNGAKAAFNLAYDYSLV